MLRVRLCGWVGYRLLAWCLLGSLELVGWCLDGWF